MQAATEKSNQLLPSEVSVLTRTWFGRARNYPIFSPTWYRYRSFALIAVSLLFFLWSGVLPAPFGSTGTAMSLKESLIFLLPFYVLCLAGPGLAVLIRRMALRSQTETAAILGALMVGMALSWGMLALFVERYERPKFDLATDIMVARKLPTFNIDLQWDIKGGSMSGMSGYRHFTGPIHPSLIAHLGSEDQQALADMQRLNAAGATIDAGRRREIEKKYVAAMENAYRHRNDARPGTVTTTIKRPNAQSTVVARKGSDALIGGASILLYCWLGGIFDLVAFVRQRGKLADHTQKDELLAAQEARIKAEMRLSVLAAQVEPHFLFNTLASVRSAIASDPQRATHIIDHMVDFLRSTIPQMRDDAGSSTVRLDTQLDSARSYLALMHERITRLQFSVDAEPGLENASMPPLMLISLVENGVKHGVEPKIGPARIEVRARRIDAPEAQLEVCVIDDGVGFGDAATGDGIGLANIQERLRSYYGERASLTLKALPDGGVAAILNLPLSFEP